jgi:hypothetical protein
VLAHRHLSQHVDLLRATRWWVAGSSQFGRKGSARMVELEAGLLFGCRVLLAVT